MLNNDKTFLSPPRETEYRELFEHLWDHGLGNERDENGDRVAWTAISLESALGHAVSSRAIDDWHSGASLPSEDNLRVLATLVSEGDKSRRSEWARALVLARRVEDRKRRARRKFERNNGTHDQASDLHTANVVTIEAAEDGDAMGATVSWSNALRSRRLLLASIFGLLLVGVTYFAFLRSAPEIAISEIRFCSQGNFSEEKKACEMGETHFTDGTQKVYVSFKTDNIRYGEPFSRRWYRNGEKFLERNDFFDETWQNFTWLHNKHGHDHGEYSMRIIVGDKVFSGKFTLGDL